MFGGHGYIREWGMEQFVRDVRIAQIYEGTNGVRAMDLVGRKLALQGGAVIQGFFDLIACELDNAAAIKEAEVIVEGTREALLLLRRVTLGLRDATSYTAGAAAVDYLRLFALVALGWMWGAHSRGGGAQRGKPHSSVENCDRSLLC